MVTNESFGTFSFYSSSSASYGLPYLSKCGAETQSAIASRYVQEVDVAVRRNGRVSKTELIFVTMRIAIRRLLG
jgi:hypothetical protein